MYTLLTAMWIVMSAPTDPFQTHGRIRVAASKTHLEHADGTPFFFLADTCWTGPALSSEADWATYLADRKAKGFTAIQFNMVSPWRTAPTDAEGHISYTITNNQLELNPEFYRRLDARFAAINQAGLLAVPVLCWAHTKGDAGKVLNEQHLTSLVQKQLARYQDSHALWILAGDNSYTTDTDMWKRIGRAAFPEPNKFVVTTHPTGENFPWKSWENESWLSVLGYQSGHGDSDKTWRWVHSGPPAEYGRTHKPTRPIINLEPAYEAHNGYQSKKPHSDNNVRHATYWSLMCAPIAGITYGGHGVWSWHTKPNEHPTGHNGTGIARHWKDALQLPAATHIGYARRFFEQLPWTELRPAQDLISQPAPSVPTQFVSIMATPKRNVIVGYLPNGGKLSWNEYQPLSTAKIQWFNPRTGEYQDGNALLTAPDQNDWLLLIRQ
jgi:hypothetical protein